MSLSGAILREFLGIAVQPNQEFGFSKNAKIPGRGAAALRVVWVRSLNLAAPFIENAALCPKFAR